jgi:hypothetical protein
MNFSRRTLLHGVISYHYKVKMKEAKSLCLNTMPWRSIRRTEGKFHVFLSLLEVSD